MKPKRFIGPATVTLILLGLFLLACEQAPSPTVVTLPPLTATAAATAVATEPPSSPTATPSPVPSASPTPASILAETIVVGLLPEQEPDSLWPVWPIGNPTEEQLLIQRGLVEPAITTLDYDYQAVLFEELPLLENGGAELAEVRLPVDPATGVFTVTDTGVYTTAQQLRVTFRILPDLYWSDGEPVRATDSVFGFNVGCTPGSSTGDQSRCERVAAYEALDDRTVRVTFQPNVQELDYFTYFWPFLPEHAWSRYTPDELSTAEQVAQRLSPSYGPYMVESWTPGESIILVRNPYYVLHGGESPAVDTIVFRFLPDSYTLLSQLLAGQVDLIDRQGLRGMDTQLLLSLGENDLIRLYPQPSRTWENIAFNLNDPDDLTQPHPILSDPRVRRAIALGMNREGIVQELFYGQVRVMNSWIPPDHWAYAGDEQLMLYPYDPEQAGTLLEEAGWILADDGWRYKDGGRMELDLYILAGQPNREQVAQRFQADMSLLGMEVHVIRVSEEQWYSGEDPLTRRAFDLFEFAWRASLEPDGQVSYLCTQIPAEGNNWRGQNYMGWCNPLAGSALMQVGQELSRERRAELYGIVQEEYTADMPALPLFSHLDYYVTAPGFLYLHLDPIEPMTWNCWEWSFLEGRQ